MEATLKELKARHVGQVVQTSVDPGCVRFMLEVEDDVVAKAKTVLVVAKRFPGHSYTVDVLQQKAWEPGSQEKQTTYELTSRYEFRRSVGQTM